MDGLRKVFLAIIVLAVFTVFATPAMAEEKPVMPDAVSYHYTTANLSATIGEMYSDEWYYLTVDNCYDEHFAVWVDGNILASYKSDDTSDFTVKQEFGTGNTAILTAGNIEVNRKVIPNGVDSFKIEYTITNIGASSISDLRLFQVLDYDIYDPPCDYAWYVPETDWIWMIDERYYQCGYSGDIHSTRHGCDFWSTEIYEDYNDGILNNQNIYPITGTADAGTGLQWNLGSLANGSSTSVTVTFWFGVPAGEEAPPTLCTDPDPPSHDFGNVPPGETRTWTFDIINCGSGTLDWTVGDDQTWMSMGPTSGTTTTEIDTVTLTIDTTGLTCGAEYTGTITVNSDGGIKTGTIRVYVPCAAEPTLCTDPDPPSHDFGNVPSGETRTWTFDITNCGSGTLTWSVSDGQPWISMGPTSGTTTTETDTVTVTIDTTGLTCDAEYTGTITVNSDGGIKTGTIRVYVPCAAEPTLCTDPDPLSHDFGNVPSGETRTWTFDITNCGSGTLDWTVGDDQTWMSMGPTSGTTTTETDTVTVTIDTTGLACGAEYTGTITVNSNDGSKTGTIRVYVPCAAEPYVRSSDSTGTEKNVFDLNEDVYCYAGNLPANDLVNIYIVPNKAWSVGDSIGSDVSGGVEIVSTDAFGDIVTTLIWTAPLTVGKYDIIVDVNQDGVLDANEPVDGLTMGEGFEAIPEFPTIALPVAAILGLMFLFQRRKE